VPVNTNQTFFVEMLLRSWTFEPGVSAMASLDPYFFLTADQINQGYTLEFSANVGNFNPVTTTPVPAALPLFMSGLAGLGFLARRRWRWASAA